MKDEIFAAGTKFQIGGCPGKRTVFHLFVVQSNIALKLFMGKGVILTLLDLIKFFDKQSLIDACDALHQAEVNKKLLRVWYKLNEHTEIEVRTRSGLTARGLAGPVTGQGGGGAALASALNLDLGIKHYFDGSQDEDCYGTVRLQPLTYIDDINRSSHNLNSVRAGNIKFASLATVKQLKYHQKKSCYLVYGPENFKGKVQMEAEEEPVMLGKNIIHEKPEEKYLGDIFSSEGLAESVDATVKERTAKVKASIYELRALVEDVRMQAVGGFEASIDMFESSIVPSLLANCGTWTEMEKKTVEKLDALQDLYGRVLLKVPQSTPKLSARAALGLLGMSWRIKQEKVLLVLALKQQEEDCLAREVLQEQMRMGWPGLGKEVQDICKEIGLPDATDVKVNMAKEDVKEAITVHHLMYIKKEMKGKKLEAMSRTDMRQRRDYTQYGVEECRMAFRLETFQFDCRVNMPTRYGRDLVCRACSPQQHLRQEKEQGQSRRMRRRAKRSRRIMRAKSTLRFSQVTVNYGRGLAT